MTEELLFAAQLGYADHIARLIGEGADPNWRRPDGVTTLMIASLTGRLGIITALLDNGAHIDLQSPDGTCALMAATIYATTTRDTSAMELLVARGANPNLYNSEGNDALMMAARNGLTEGVVLLLRAGTSPKRANNHGITALMQAARGHLVETVRLLLRGGADPTQSDERRRTALHYSRELGEPPPDLASLLAPAELGAAPIGKREVSKFDKPDFKISLMGTWSEQEAGDGFDFIETTRERQILVSVAPVAETLAIEHRRRPLAAVVENNQNALRASAQEKCRFSPVRFAEANDVVQARFNGVDELADVFFAVSVYAAAFKFVTLMYYDFRPQLSEEARGRQAQESVASFRVK